MPRDPDAVTVLVDGTEFEAWNEIAITTAIDQYSTIAMAAPFEADRIDFRETFRPFSFRDFDVLIGGEKEVTGTLLDAIPQVGPESSSVQVTAYAKPGLLHDVSMPSSALPLEWKKVGLRVITAAILSPFGLDGPVFEQGAVEGTRFDKPSMEPDGKPQDFLVGLAKQRGLVINDTRDGALRYWKSVGTESPVVHFEAGKEPLVKIDAAFNARAFFSELTGFAKGSSGKPSGGKYRVPNPLATGGLRPHSFQLDDTDAADVPAAVRAKAGRMLGECASYTVSDLPTWRDPSGALWRPNTTIKITAPNAMIYQPYEFLIRQVTLGCTHEKKWAELNVVLPGAYSGEFPDSLPGSQ